MTLKLHQFWEGCFPGALPFSIQPVASSVLQWPESEVTYGWPHVTLLSRWWGELECELSVFIVRGIFAVHSSSVTQPRSAVSPSMLNEVLVSNWIFHQGKLYYSPSDVMRCVSQWEEMMFSHVINSKLLRGTLWYLFMLAPSIWSTLL